MKILITGNLGFVGSATQKLLEECGHQVIGFDVMENKDIRDVGQLEKCIQDTQPDRILHLAAIARFSEADKDPKLAFETNAIGTMNVARVASKHHIGLVYSSTGSVYMPIKRKPPITEDFEAMGNSVYGCSKYTGETYVRGNNPYIILRYAHLYGSEKKFHGLIGGFLQRINRGLAPVLYNGLQSNDFTYIKDVARANFVALTAPWDLWNETYNVGTGEELSAIDAGNLICKIFGYKGKIEKREAREVDPLRFVYDTKKAENKLGFKAQYSFKDGLLDMAKELGYNQSNDKTTKERLPESIQREKQVKTA